MIVAMPLLFARRLLLLPSLLILCYVMQLTAAMQANPAPFVVTQHSSGAKVALYLRGSEYQHMLQDQNGCVYVRAASIHFLLAKRNIRISDCRLWPYLV